MLNEKNDSFLLYMNGKPVAIGPDFETTAKLAESVARERPRAELMIRVADRLTASGQPVLQPDARRWRFVRSTSTWENDRP